MDVTVAIPTIGRIDMLSDCVRSIFAGSVHPAEILLLDQSQNDETYQLSERLTSDALKVRCIKCRGSGIARNMNLALKSSNTDRLLVTHDDCHVDHDWVRAGVEALRDNPGGIVTGRVLPGGDKPELVPSTNTSTVPFDYTGSLKYGSLFPNNMGLYCNAALEIGGFDERPGFYDAAEDIDFAYRWLKQNRALRFDPELIVTHNDWRTPLQLKTVYRRYARCAGRFYGKYLLRGDKNIAKQVVNDLRQGFRTTVTGLLRQENLNTNPFAPYLLYVPIGICEGVFESLRINLKKSI